MWVAGGSKGGEVGQLRDGEGLDFAGQLWRWVEMGESRDLIAWLDWDILSFEEELLLHPLLYLSLRTVNRWGHRL